MSSFLITNIFCTIILMSTISSLSFPQLLTCPCKILLDSGSWLLSFVLHKTNCFVCADNLLSPSISECIAASYLTIYAQIPVFSYFSITIIIPHLYAKLVFLGSWSVMTCNKLKLCMNYKHNIYILNVLLAFFFNCNRYQCCHIFFLKLLTFTATPAIS